MIYYYVHCLWTLCAEEFEKSQKLFSKLSEAVLVPDMLHVHFLDNWSGLYKEREFGLMRLS